MTCFSFPPREKERGISPFSPVKRFSHLSTPAPPNTGHADWFSIRISPSKRPILSAAFGRCSFITAFFPDNATLPAEKIRRRAESKRTAAKSHVPVITAAPAMQTSHKSHRILFFIILPPSVPALLTGSPRGSHGQFFPDTLPWNPGSSCVPQRP